MAVRILFQLSFFFPSGEKRPNHLGPKPLRETMCPFCILVVNFYTLCCISKNLDESTAFHLPFAICSTIIHYKSQQFHYRSHDEGLLQTNNSAKLLGAEVRAWHISQPHRNAGPYHFGLCSCFDFSEIIGMHSAIAPNSHTLPHTINLVQVARCCNKERICTRVMFARISL